MNTYLIIGGILLVPLIPVAILFKGLRSTAEVGGKLDQMGLLKDIQIKLGGAFAGYILIVGGIFFYLEYQRSHPLELIYQVKGNIKFEDFDSHEHTISYKDVQVFVDPPSYKAFEDGEFKMNIMVRPLNGKPEFPDVTFFHPNYRPAVIHLDDIHLKSEEKLIHIPSVLLKKIIEQ